MSKIFTVGYYALAILVLVLGLFLVLLQTAIIPGFAVKIVQSGSMEPEIKTGSGVVVKAQTRYNVGDIITFNSGTRRGTPTTHRIIATELSSGNLLFTTKGDANEEVDVDKVPLDKVIGQVIGHIPFLGYLLDFARQPLAFVLLVIVPGLLIVVEEVSVMYRQFRRRREDTI